MGKDKVSDRKLVEIIYRSVFNIIEDETGNASYRKYFDKVLRDIFDMDGVITTLLMSGNQFKYIKKLLNNPDYKQFCQMLLRDDDIKAVHDLVRVAYDAAQIANKPKKSISSRDIKSYRYLTKLYTQGIKALRKKYKCNADSKKAYKTKYANLDAMLGNNHKSNYMYDLGTLDDDESFGDLFEDDDEDEEDDSQFDPMNGFDLDDLPSRFVINKNAEWTPPRRNLMILDGDDPNLSLYEDFEDSEENISSDKEIMPPEQFQRYAMSIFERLLNKMENEDNPQEIETLPSNPINEEYNIPIEVSKSQIIPESSEEGENNSVEDSDNSDSILIDTPSLTPTEDIQSNQDTTEPQESGVQKKPYDEMTREECINEFNDISSKAIASDDPK